MPSSTYEFHAGRGDARDATVSCGSRRRRPRKGRPPIVHVLIIGDSISISYTQPLARKLGGRFCVRHCEGNAGDSRRVVESLDRWLAQVPEAELIVLNCGLHDIKRDRESGRINVPLDEYRANVRTAVDRLIEEKKVILWAQTTPVLYERHLSKGFDRRDEDVTVYNTAAEQVMLDTGVAICRLNDEIRRAGPKEMLGPDGVHMTDEGSERLAAVLARDVRSRWTA